MPQFKFAGMNCSSKHVHKAPKVQIHMISQLTNKHIGKDYSEKPTYQITKSHLSR